MNIKIVSSICLAVLIAIVGIRTYSHFVKGPPPFLATPRMGDYGMNVDFSKKVCEQRQYPPSFSYPLPAVMGYHFWDSFGFVPGAIAWASVLAVSMIGSFFATNHLIGGVVKSQGMAMLLAFGAVEYYLIWDLKTANINSFYLLFVLSACWCWLKGKKTGAGILFAASVSIKLYSIAFLPYLIFRKQWRITSVMGACLLVFFAGFPTLFFGWHDTVSLTKQWLAGILATSRPDFILTYEAYKVSLSWVMTVLLNPLASGGKFNVCDLELGTVATIVKGMNLGWVLLVAGYFVDTIRHEPNPRRKGLAFVLDISVLLLVLLPASPVLEPHHLVVLLVPAFALVRAMLDRDLPMSARVAAGLTVGMGACLIELGPGSPLRGLGVMLDLLLYLVGIWIVRRACGFHRPATPAIENESISHAEAKLMP
jgi:hypothetical protein